MAKRFVVNSFLLFSMVLAGCATRNSVGVPADLLGLTVGMNKADAQNHLQEIAEFARDERKNQQVWTLKNDSRFSAVAIGYSRENKVRYVTAFVDKARAKERIPFSGVGDLKTAKAVILEPHYRYIWEVPPIGGGDAYAVNVYGDNPEFVTIYTLVERPEPGKAVDADEDTD